MTIPSVQIGISGHRNYQDRTNIRWWMENIARKHGKDVTIITGGAVGTDMIAAEEAIRAGLRSAVILPMPYAIHTSRWSKEQKERLNKVLASSQVKIACPKHEYNEQSYFERNAQLAEDSDILIAFWSGRRPCGTFDTILKARNAEAKVFNGITKEQI